MTSPIRVDARAAEEAEEAMRWYEERRPGLGADFATELEHAVADSACMAEES
jgi:hypothetical protein